MPSYYPGSRGAGLDTDITGKLPALTAAIRHLSKRADVDASRIGLVGFSLGAGISMAYINSMPAGTVRAFADFYGYVSPLLAGGVEKFPPTIVLHYSGDPIVPPVEHSEPLIQALAKAKIIHEPAGPPYPWYKIDDQEKGHYHDFAPGGPADLDSRKRAGQWMVKYV